MCLFVYYSFSVTVIETGIFFEYQFTEKSYFTLILSFCKPRLVVTLRCWCAWSRISFYWALSFQHYFFISTENFSEISVLGKPVVIPPDQSDLCSTLVCLFVTHTHIYIYVWLSL